MKYFERCNFNSLLKIVLLVGLIGLVTCSLLAIIYQDKKLPQNEEVLFWQPLTGLWESQKTDLNPIAFIIDNATEVRPQAGLRKASIIYEALAEGGITRLMAIYNFTDQVEKIGPIRSVRPYFLDWASEYQPALFHVGGSPQALEAIKEYSIINVDEMSVNEIFFERTEDLDWPHSVYSSTALLQNIEKLKNRQINFEPWEYLTETESYCPEEAQKVSIDYSLDNYQVEWLYNCGQGKYFRSNGLVKHLDEEANQLSVKKVIIQFVKSWQIDTERLGMQTVGEGKALIFQNGQVQEGIWRKNEKESRTNYYDQQGQIIKLVPGQTWIQIVPPLTDVTY